MQVWQPSNAPQATDGDSRFHVTTLLDGRRRVHHTTFNDVAETISQKLQVRALHPCILLVSLDLVVFYRLQRPEALLWQHS